MNKTALTAYPPSGSPGQLAPNRTASVKMGTGGGPAAGGAMDPLMLVSLLAKGRGVKGSEPRKHMRYGAHTKKADEYQLLLGKSGGQTVIGKTAGLFGTTTKDPEVFRKHLGYSKARMRKVILKWKSEGVNQPKEFVEWAKTAVMAPKYTTHVGKAGRKLLEQLITKAKRAKKIRPQFVPQVKLSSDAESLLAFGFMDELNKCAATSVIAKGLALQGSRMKSLVKSKQAYGTRKAK